MDPCYMLGEGVALSDRLLSQLDGDRDGIRGCLEGELLDEYLKAADKAEERVRSVKQRLLQLQTEQRQLLLLDSSTI